MNRSTLSALSILVCLGSMGACQSDPNMRVGAARADNFDDEQEGAREQARLAREQQQRRNELVQDQREDGDSARERSEERSELAEEQGEDGTDLRDEQTEEQKENELDVREASQQGAQDQREFARAARERLRAMQARTRELKHKSQTATASTQRESAAALDAMPEKFRETARDIEALETISAANWQHKKTQVDRKLSSLERSLDRVESRR